MTTKEFIETYYKIKLSDPKESTVDFVDGTVVPILAPNANRFSWTLTNLGNTPIYLRFAPNPTSSYGLYCAPQGGFITVMAVEDLLLPVFPLWGVTSGANSSALLVVVELL